MLFRYISPLLVVESSQQQIEDLIPEILKVSGKQVIADFKEENKVIKTHTASLYLNEFNLILVQFKALKLITLSSRKHPMSDNNIYWTLTAYGDQLMTELNAIKKLK